MEGKLICFLCGKMIDQDQYEVHVGFCTGKGTKKALAPAAMCDLPGPGPRAVQCYICGKAFFRSSIDIHISSCAKAWQKREELKPKSERRPLPQPPKGYEQMKAQATRSGQKPVPRVPAALAKAMAAAEQQDPYEDEQFIADSFKEWQKSLVLCERCGRKFMPDRFHAHLKSCTPMDPAERAKKAAQKGKVPREGVVATMKKKAAEKKKQSFM